MCVIHYKVSAPGYKTREGQIRRRYSPDVHCVMINGYVVNQEAWQAERKLKQWLLVDALVAVWTPHSRCNTKTIMGWFTTYAVVNRSEDATREVHHKKLLIELEPDAAQQQPGQPGSQAGQGSESGWEQRLKEFYEQAKQKNPKLVKTWEGMGWLVAAKKDWDDLLAGKEPKNLAQYEKRMQTGAGRVANVLWTMKESMLMLPGVSHAATVEEWAQNTKKAYKKMTGMEFYQSGYGESEWKGFAVNVGQHLNDLKAAGAIE